MWTRISIAVQASVLLGIAGCGSPAPQPGQAPAHTQDQSQALGVVLLRAAPTLAPTPGAPPASRPATTLALVIGHTAGATRLLAADGTHGWTTESLPIPSPVAVDCPPESMPLFRQSPDDVLPESGDSAAATSRTGTLLGASMTGYPASQVVLLAPPRFQVVMPTLHVQCGIDGYAPPEWLRLRVDQDVLDRVVGLVRQPFLGAVARTSIPSAPSPGEPVLTFLEDRLADQPSAGAWPDVEVFYRDPDDSARTFAVYASGAARLFVFSQPRVRLHFPAYQPYAVRVVPAQGDWFVEVVSIFGDGAYSTLFHVRQDGSVTFQPLSRSDGELRDDTRASWGLLDGAAWIARATGSQVTLSGVPSPLFLAPLRTTREYVAPIEPSAETFPTADGQWLVAVPHRTEADAARRAAGGTVQRYPG